MHASCTLGHRGKAGRASKPPRVARAITICLRLQRHISAPCARNDSRRRWSRDATAHNRSGAESSGANRQLQHTPKQHTNRMRHSGTLPHSDSSAVGTRHAHKHIRSNKPWKAHSRHRSSRQRPLAKWCKTVSGTCCDRTKVTLWRPDAHPSGVQHIRHAFDVQAAYPATVRTACRCTLCGAATHRHRTTRTFWALKTAPARGADIARCAPAVRVKRADRSATRGG
jgi:hypothetical protein